MSKRFGDRAALGSIDLIAEPACTTVLIGPSGCGKSTLLRAIMGLVRIDAGSVLVDGVEITEASATLLRRRIGYVIQDGGLFPHLTARGNVTLVARHLGWDRARMTTRIEELCALTQFPADALDRFPLELSGGQRQRVSLMRALMLDPSVLLLDEPLGAIDPMIRAELQADLKHIFELLKKTVILVTHDLAEAGFLGGAIVLLQSGRIVQRGRFEELWRAPADPFVTRFLRAQRRPLPMDADLVEPK